MCVAYTTNRSKITNQKPTDDNSLKTIFWVGARSVVSWLTYWRWEGYTWRKYIFICLESAYPYMRVSTECVKPDPDPVTVPGPKPTSTTETTHLGILVEYAPGARSRLLPDRSVVHGSRSHPSLHPSGCSDAPDPSEDLPPLLFQPNSLLPSLPLVPASSLDPPPLLESSSSSSRIHLGPPGP